MKELQVQVPVTQPPPLQEQPIMESHVQEEVPVSVQDVTKPSTLEETSPLGLEIIEVRITPLEQFNVQELFQRGPMNRKRQHEASNYFEELSQKLRRISTEPKPSIVDDEPQEEEGLGIEDATDDVLFGKSSCVAAVEGCTNQDNQKGSGKGHKSSPGEL